MPDNDEIIALLRLYGNVTVVDENRITFWKDINSSLYNHPTEWYSMILEWMEDTVKDIEDGR